MTRTEFRALTDMDEPMLKSLARRDQLPFRAEDDPERKLGEYTLMEAFLLILANDLATSSANIGRTAAGNIVASFALELYRFWPEIGATGHTIADGQHAEDEILCGRFDLPGYFNPLPFCEPTSKLGSLIALRRPVRIISTSASRGMAVLLRRAARHNIDLGEKLFLIRSPEPAPEPVEVINTADVYARMNAQKPG